MVRTKVFNRDKYEYIWGKDVPNPAAIGMNAFKQKHACRQGEMARRVV